MVEGAEKAGQAGEETREHSEHDEQKAEQLQDAAWAHIPWWKELKKLARPARRLASIRSTTNRKPSSCRMLIPWWKELKKLARPARRLASNRSTTRRTPSRCRTLMKATTASQQAAPREQLLEIIGGAVATACIGSCISATQIVSP